MDPHSEDTEVVKSSLKHKISWSAPNELINFAFPWNKTVETQHTAATVIDVNLIKRDPR